jgi:uncharacterized protein YdbL (DUF1318 family)
MKLGAGFLIIAAALACSPTHAQARAQIGDAIATGQVGERYDGYMGAVGAVSPDLQRQVAAINLRRRNLYIGLAMQRRVSAEAVGLATGCEMLGRLAPGAAYMLQDGSWRHRSPGQPAPVPDYCR